MTRRSGSTRLLAVALAAGLSGCVGAGASLTPAQNAAAITVTREQGGRFLSFVGPQSQHAAPFLGVPDTNYDVLRSWLDTSNGQVAHQLYVEDSYSGAKRDWNAAQDQAGKPLRFIPISQNEITCNGGCSYAEEFAAALPEPLLRADAGAGLDVFFTAKSGMRMTIHIPGDEIANQLAAIASARAGLASAAPPAPSAAK